MGRLLLLFIVVPALELALLVEIGQRIGTLATIALIVVTGMLGATLARRQGLGVLRQMQEQMGEGAVPAAAMLDGVLILVAAALLVTPGILTDAAGFACLVPAFRQWLRRRLWARLAAQVESGRIRVHAGGFGAGPSGPVYDVTPDPDADLPEVGRRGRREPPQE